MKKLLPGLCLFVVFCLVLSCLGACFNLQKENIPAEQVQEEAYVPVYGDPATAKEIRSMAAQPTLNAGKIYVFGHYLFQIEKFRGIHVIDYSNRTAPVKLGFIKSLGCSELAVKGGYLITNNMDDLVTINISILTGVKEMARIPAAFPNFYLYGDNYPRPPEKGKYFVCPDIQKGEVISWELKKNVIGAYCFND